MDPARGQVTDDNALMVFRAIEVVRSLNIDEGDTTKPRDMPLQALQCFLYVCSHDKCHKSRTKEVDPLNRRRSILRLTPLGVRIKNELLNELNGIHNHSV